MRRRTDNIRCIECAATNAHERDNHGVIEIHCPDCGATFGRGNLPKECPGCHRRIYSHTERAQGRCSSCEVASWTPEKASAVDKLIGLASREPKPSDAEVDALMDELVRLGQEMGDYDPPGPRPSPSDVAERREC